MFLQTEDAQFALLSHRRDGAGRGVGAGQGGERDDVVLHGGAADGALVVERRAAQRRVDYQVDLVALDQVYDVRSPLVDFEDPLGGHAGFVQKTGRAPSRDDLEPEVAQPPGHTHGVLLVVVVDADEGRAFERQTGVGAHLRLGEGHAETLGHSHHLAGRTHLGPEHGVYAGEFDEREDRLLDEEVVHGQLVGQVEIRERPPGHHARRNLGQRRPGGLRDEGHGARGARIDFEHVDDVVLDGELNVHQPAHFQSLGEPPRVPAHRVEVFWLDHVRRQHARRVAGMDAGLLDVLLNARDHALLAVGQRVDVDLEGVFQKAVDQHRLFGRGLDGAFHIAFQALLVVNDHHRAPAQHVTRAHEHRIADRGRAPLGLVYRDGRSVNRLRDVQIGEQFAESLAVFGQVDRFGAGADDRNAGLVQPHRQVQRRLAAELHDHAVGLLQLDDAHHVFKRQRLEIEAVGSVVIGRDGLRVAVNHDRLVPVLFERERGVATTVVEFYALPDAVRAGAEDHDLLAVARGGFAFALVGRIEIWSVGLELGAAGVHAFVNRDDAFGLAAGADLVFVAFDQVGDPGVGKAHPLRSTQPPRRKRTQSLLSQRLLRVDDVAQLGQEPGVDARQLVDFIDGPAALEGGVEVMDAFGVRDDQFAAQCFVVDVAELRRPATFEGAHAFHERLFERAPDGHRLADRFHLRAERVFRAGEFLEGPFRYLDHDVIDRRLERGGGLLGDVVLDLIERVADGQLGRYLGDRESGGLRCQRRRAGDARVHLDHAHLAVAGVDRELDVRPAGLDADFADNLDRGVAHRLVLAVGQRLRRGDGDRVAGVYAHRVEILDRTDDHDVVGQVAHHLEFVLFPADDRLFDQYLADRAGRESALGGLLELFVVVGYAAARAPERE